MGIKLKNMEQKSEKKIRHIKLYRNKHNTDTSTDANAGIGTDTDTDKNTNTHINTGTNIHTSTGTDTHIGISRRAGFTFIEVLIALTIISISLTALLKLQLISIRSAEQAVVSTAAVLLAQEKIAQAQADTSTGSSPLFSAVDSGTVDNNNRKLTWRRTITNVSPTTGSLTNASPIIVNNISSDNTGTSSLKKITVEVESHNGRKIQLFAYKANRTINIQKSNDKHTKTER